MKNLKESILDQNLGDQYKVDLTDGDLNYKLDLIHYGSDGKTMMEILTRPNYYGFSELEAANIVHQYVEANKLLKKKGFKKYNESEIRKQHILIDASRYGGGIYEYGDKIISSPTPKGYRIIWNLGNWSFRSDANMFAVCEVKKKLVREFLYPIEIVAGEEHLNRIKSDTVFKQIPTTQTKSVEESIKYVEKKYGKL